MRFLIDDCECCPAEPHKRDSDVCASCLAEKLKEEREDNWYTEKALELCNDSRNLCEANCAEYFFSKPHITIIGYWLNRAMEEK